MGDDRLERLTELLRTLRYRLDVGTDDPEQWELDLYSYDEALIVAADLLDVEVAPQVRDEMSPEDRTDLEQRLAAAGLDVRAPSESGL